MATAAAASAERADFTTGYHLGVHNIESLGARCQRLREINKSLGAELSRVNDLADELKGQLATERAASAEQLATKATEITGLNRTLDTTHAEMLDTAEKLANVTISLHALEGRVEEAEEQKNSATDELTAAQRQIATLNIDVQEISEESKEKDIALAEAAAKNKSLEDRIAAAEEAAQAKQALSNKLVQELEDATEKAETAEQEKAKAIADAETTARTAEQQAAARVAKAQKEALETAQATSQAEIAKLNGLVKAGRLQLETQRQAKIQEIALRTQYQEVIAQRNTENEQLRAVIEQQKAQLKKQEKDLALFAHLLSILQETETSILQAETPKDAV